MGERSPSWVSAVFLIAAPGKSGPRGDRWCEMGFRGRGHRALAGGRRGAARALAGFLAALLLFCALPLATAAPAATGNTAEISGARGTDFTDNAYIAQKLQELFNLLPYSKYPYFTIWGDRSCGNSQCSYCMGANVAREHPNLRSLGIVDPHTCWSCFAFARYAFLYIFGITADGLNYYGNVEEGGNLQRVGRVARGGIGNIEGDYDAYTRENLLALLGRARPGDILQANGSAGSGNHTMVFLGADSGGITVLHDNMFKYNEDALGAPYDFNRVLVSRITYENLTSYWGNIVSVLRARQDAWSEAWSGGRTCETHTYTDEGGDFCTVCGARYEATYDPAAAGVYRAVTVSTLRPSPYFSAEGREILPEGATLAVAASLTNSVGDRWYLLTDGSYTHGDNLIAAQEPSGAPTIAMAGYPAGNLPEGASFDLSGSVEGKSTLSSVDGTLISSSGEERQSAHVSPGMARLDIYASEVNYSLRFGRLSPGKWHFLLSARDEDGRTALFKSDFTVGGGGEDYTPPAPPAPVLSGKSADSVTLEKVPGLEYRRDGGEWQASNLFTGLSPETTYLFTARVAASGLANPSPESPPLTVTTDPPPTIIVPPPELSSVTDTSVTLALEEGYEYSMDRVTWQESPTFTGLAPSTAYFFYHRPIGEASAACIGLPVLTDKPTPAAPPPPALTFAGESELHFEGSDLFEYSLDGGAWQRSPIFAGLLPGHTYSVRARLAATAAAYPGAPSEPTLAATDRHYPVRPAAPTLAEKHGGTVTLTATQGMEYSLDGEHFTASPVFKGLQVSMVYVFYQRVAESSESYGSETSDGLSVSILPGSLSSRLYRVDEEAREISAIPAATPLREVISSLPEGDYVRVYGPAGDQIGGGGFAGTGVRVAICDGDRPETVYTLLVEGDLDGDGIPTVNDAALLTAALSEGASLPLAAADLTRDGKLNLQDLAALRSRILHGQ